VALSLVKVWPLRESPFPALFYPPSTLLSHTFHCHKPCLILMCIGVRAKKHDLAVTFPSDPLPLQFAVFSQTTWPCHLTVTTSCHAPFPSQPPLPRYRVFIVHGTCGARMLHFMFAQTYLCELDVWAGSARVWVSNLCNCTEKNNALVFKKGNQNVVGYINKNYCIEELKIKLGKY